MNIFQKMIAAYLKQREEKKAFNAAVLEGHRRALDSLMRPGIRDDVEATIRPVYPRIEEIWVKEDQEIKLCGLDDGTNDLNHERIQLVSYGWRRKT